MRLLGLLLVFLISALPITAHSEERFALVVGNSNYQSNPLRNPRNDAIDMAEQLSSMGYKLYQDGPLLDLDRVSLEAAVSRFAGSLPTNASAVFYYAGHGMAIENDNYLIPINHQLKFQEQLPDRTVSLRSIVDVLKNANPEGTNVVLLDACRDNPLVRSFRSVQTGLRRLNDIPRGIFVGYAADNGQVAEDGLGRNGTYTAELLKVMANNPRVIVEIAHKEVAQNVYQKTNGKQFPVSENKVYGNWCFASCDSPIAEQPENTPLPKNNDWQAVATEPELETAKRDSGLSIKSNRKTWQIVGGVALGVIAAGLALSNSSGGDGEKGSSSSGSQFKLILIPPE